MLSFRAISHASSGQTEAHTPHPMQTSSLTMGYSSPMVKAWIWHLSTQIPHAEHLSLCREGTKLLGLVKDNPLSLIELRT
jgi:hypothetical protein